MNKILTLAFVIILISFIVSFAILPYLPEKIETHWNSNGNADGYSSKNFIFLVPVISLLLFALLVYLPKIDPMKRNYDSFREHYYKFVLIFVVFMVYIDILTISWHYYKFNMMQFISLGFALLFFYIGVLIENVKQNWFIGIRTPWTLSSKQVWDETHKLSGRLFKISAIISVMGFVFPGMEIWFILVPIISAVIWSLVYSYVVFKRIKTKKNLR